MPLTNVGAWLVLEPGNFATNADAAIAKMAEVSAAAKSMGAEIAAANDIAAGSFAKVDAAGAGAGLGAGAGAKGRAKADAEAFAAGETAKQSAIAKTAAAEEKAAADSKTRLESMAGNPALKKVATWGTGGLAAGAYEMIKSYTKFQQDIAQSAVDAGMKHKDIPAAQAAALQISRDTGVAADDVAKSLYRVQSALSGTHATLKDVISTTKDAAKLDVLFNIPKGVATEQTARIMGAMMYAQLPGAKNPNDIMALVNSAVGHGDIRGQDMIAALGKVLPAAKSLGVAAPDLFGWIDTLTKSGMQGSQAGTLVRTSLQQLATPSEQGNKAEQMLGIHGGDLLNIMKTPGQGIPAAIKYMNDAMTQFNPTASFPKFGKGAAGHDAALAQLKAWGILNPGDAADPAVIAQYKKLGMKAPATLTENTIQAFQDGNMTQDQKDQVKSALLTKIFGGAKGSLPMLALMNDPNAYAKLTQSIREGATPAALAASMKLAMNTPERQMQIAETNIKDTGIQIGAWLTPAAVTGLNVLKDIAVYLGDHHAVLAGLLISLGAVVTAAIAVRGLNFLKNLGADLKNLVGLGSKASPVVAGETMVAAGATMETAGATMDTAAGTLLVAADTMMVAVEKSVVGTVVGGGGLTAAESISGRLASGATTLEGGAVAAGGTAAAAGVDTAAAAGGGAIAAIGGAGLLTAGAIVAAGVGLSYALGVLSEHLLGWQPPKPGTPPTHLPAKPHGSHPNLSGLGLWTGTDHYDKNQTQLNAQEERKRRNRGQHPHGSLGSFITKNGVSSWVENPYQGAVNKASGAALEGTGYATNARGAVSAAQGLANAYGPGSNHSRGDRQAVENAIQTGVGQRFTQAGQQLHQGKDDTGKAAALLLAAGTKHSVVADQQRAAAGHMKDAAQKHFDAAAKLVTAAQQMQDAAGKIGAMQVKINMTDLSAGINAAIANGNARK